MSYWLLYQLLFDLEILGIIAKTLLKTGINSAFVTLTPQHKLLTALIAAYSHFNPYILHNNLLDKLATLSLGIMDGRLTF
ncbi:hypothetical protein [Paenibacillus tarimensis]|uniref:hypothetical protein n=1 Tax=Paenibacillus tarimensis TaxID=416012 RepID=UPI001F43DD2D|nr:hypothetical protein [Paenibacillus tarimensis]MCF2942516.1 hypothetical protein [Paenibacillus tarimensis]